jgi:hypothetical protein
MNPPHDRSSHPGSSLSVRPRSQAALLEGGEDDASVVARATRQLLDAVRSLAA